MDFNKMLGKSKDPSAVLSEKEYKCVSLQAITGEAIKENNKKRLKNLLEEINGHLTDLRAIKEAKYREKCDKLIKQFEECLLKIVNNKYMDFLTPISNQLQELQNLANTAIRDQSLDDLCKLAERIERNTEVIKEIPEVKNARSLENGDDEKVLEVVNKYTSLLNKVMAQINAQRRSVSGPVSLEGMPRPVGG